MKPEEDEKPIDAPGQRRLPPTLRRAWYGLNQAFRRRIAAHKATPDQFTVLRQLTEGPKEGLTQRHLCALMSSDPNTIASLLKRMQDAGLVERTPHEADRRAHRVKLRPEGKKLFKKLRVVALELQERVLSTLPEERRDQFLVDLETLAEACWNEAASKTMTKVKKPVATTI